MMLATGVGEMGVKGPNKSKVQYVFLGFLRPHPLLCCPSPAQASSLSGQSLTSQGQWRTQVWLPYWSPTKYTLAQPSCCGCGKDPY